MKYEMLTNSGTKGKVTGQNRAWKPGQVIDAPAGEFDHLAAHHYKVLGKAEKAQREPVAETATFTPDDQAAADATNAAAQLAAEHGIDLASVQGSGTGGRITKGDIEALIGAD